MADIFNSRLLLLLGSLWLLAVATTARPLPPADTAAVVVISQVPASGFVFTKGWKFRAGDNPAWAQPGFDDEQWDTLNLVRAVRRLPVRLPAGTSWWRLRFRLADSLRSQGLLLRRYAMGATEIYLNGRLVERIGPVWEGSAWRFASKEPVRLPAFGAATQVLAVRFTPWVPPVQLAPRTPLLVFSLVPEAQFYHYQVLLAARMTNFYVTLGIFLLLTLLHGAFLVFNPSQRANFYFALYAFTLALASLSNNLVIALPTSTSMLVYTVGQLMLMLSNLWMVRALYLLYGVRPGWVYRVLWAGFGLMVGVGAVRADFGALIPLLFPAFVAVAFIEQLRLAGRAMYRQQRGAYIIGAGFLGSLLALLITVGLMVLWPAALGAVSNLVFMFLYVPPALGVSLYLAREFALDAQLLQVKLREVEHLSAQTLAQEQDKQALLASQNETLEHQVHARTSELRQSLTNLQATQQQLIQKEKMASLGELTAGIAHEIQNPLNFVNNFADVSSELMAELQEALATSDTAEATALAQDVTQNLGKIHQHGQRASSIVRGMLEHSRQSTGERAPTDINALCDEYLRLAYHGLRAKDKTANAALETDLAPALPLVLGVGADVGRVLLNLFTNAFYAVQQRQQAGEPGYVPTVGVATRQVGQQVEIRVRDNGTGMPAEVQAKIFQPFFTTKPTGEGTGLGLSLAHDIIVQGHGGTLTVGSQPGVGTEFVITLPS